MEWRNATYQEEEAEGEAMGEAGEADSEVLVPTSRTPSPGQDLTKPVRAVARPKMHPIGSR